jgi:hypothetical protein
LALHEVRANLERRTPAGGKRRSAVEIKMPLEVIKMSLAATWMAIVVALGLVGGATSTRSVVVLAALAGLPSLAVMLLWHDPTQTMSERIREGRR